MIERVYADFGASDAILVQSPLVSVVIVTWNRKADVLEAVESVYTQRYPHVEVVVVDNASTDGTAEALRQSYPRVRLIELHRNLGAAGGRNPGLAQAQGEIIFLLDSDASLDQDTLTQVVQRFQANPNLGVIACKVVNAYTGELDRNTGWFFSEKDKVDQDKEFYSYSFCAAGTAIRKQVTDQVGQFWDQLGIYREEDDLSLRVWDAGYEILYFPRAIVHHRASPAERVRSNKREYYDLRNSLYVYIVRYPWWMLVRQAPLKIATALVKGYRKGCMDEVLRAQRDVLLQLPSLWQQRKPINNHTARIYLDLQRQHGPLRWDLKSWLEYKASAARSVGNNDS
jgi:GT2 family glycosyltransferase